MGWVGLGPHFPTCSGLGWVSQLMGWVGSGQTKWTHGQLWSNARPCNSYRRRSPRRPLRHRANRPDEMRRVPRALRPIHDRCEGRALPRPPPPPPLDRRARRESLRRRRVAKLCI